jgi:hypothetical protein
VKWNAGLQQLQAISSKQVRMKRGSKKVNDEAYEAAM